MDENGFFAVEDGVRAVAFSLASDRQSVETLIAAANRADELARRVEELEAALASIAAKQPRDGCQCCTFMHMVATDATEAAALAAKGVRDV